MNLRNPICQLVLAACVLAAPASADVITIGGAITQSTSDGTGPAVDNPDLNNILDGDAYLITLSFPRAITAAGTYDLTAGGSLQFSDAAAPATESSFDFISLTVASDAGFFDISLLGCLTSGSGCAFGNQINANFQILQAGLNSSVPVAATGLDQPHPLDLLEDDGVTDIHGSITTYSYTAAAPSTVPEPSSALLLVGAVALAGALRHAKEPKN